MTAKCALVIVDLDAERTISCDVFTDDGDGLDPYHKAEALWRSVKDDWPTCQPVYAMNDQAAQLKADVLLWRVGMLDDGHPMQVRIEAHNAAVAGV